MEEDIKFLELKRLEILEQLKGDVDSSDRILLELDLMNIETYFKIKKHKI